MTRNTVRNVMRGLLLSWIVGVWFPGGVSAKTLYVSTIGSHVSPFTNWSTASTSIQAAVTAAASGDLILATNGTYRITSEISITKNVQVQSVQGSDFTRVISTGTRCFQLGHTNAVVDGFAMSTSTTGSVSGAGFNISSAGGTVRNCDINTCVTTGSGGGGYVVANGRVDNCYFGGNVARGSGGGGLWVGYSSVISNCTFQGNTANGNGGGVLLGASNLVTDCWVVANKAGNNGGGIHAPGAKNTRIERTAITQNVVSNYDGGGIYASTEVWIANSLIAKNTCYDRGGGICAVGKIRVESCTIAHNRGGTGGGLFLQNTSQVWNAISVFNTSAASSFSNYYADASSPISNSCVNPLPGAPSSENILAHPQFVDTNSMNYRLAYGSPCINRTTPISPVTLDLARVRRPQGSGLGAALMDMGAYEWNASHVAGDFNMDKQSDWPVFNPANGAWYMSTVQGAVLTWADQWGWSTAKPIAGDYNGDGTWDQAVFDTVGGYWYIKTLTGNVLAWKDQWGWSTAKPVPGDYDGNGRWDQAVFDTAGGFWYIRNLNGSVLTWQNQWGWSTAKPVPGDYDGDGRWDQAVFDTAGGFWYIKTLSGTILTWQNQWGWSTAKPVPGDYDGDGVYDLAVYDTATGYWYVKSLDGRVIAWQAQFGWPGAVIPSLEATP